ncbi:MAG: helix-turn-helix transcriptional regulator [Oscillospiraceae bacterium]
MAKSGNQKQKLLVLRQLLLERTDEEHPMTVQQMINELERWGIQAERKSLYDDLEQLRAFGLDVQCRKGRAGGWFVGERDFELPELKLLVDAVQSSKFITRRKSDALIRKLESLAGVHQAKQLQRQVYVNGRVKTMNESIYYNVDKLHAAVGERRAVSFLYFDYNSRKEKVLRREGARYTVSPCGLVWDNENYYLVGWDHDHGDVRHYRVDKMSGLTVTGSPLEGAAAGEFDMAGYAKKHFGMFSGTDANVTLRCREELAGVVLDRFGQEAMLVPGEEGTFTVTVAVVVSPQFWGWLFGLGSGVELTAPAWAAEEYRKRLRDVASLYEK